VGLVEVLDGQIAQTFSFTVGTDDYFVQFNAANMAQARRTEVFFEDRLRARGIPLRRVVKSGAWNDLSYTVSAKVKGSPLSSLGDEDLLRVLPAVLDQLRALSTVEVHSTTGYGWLDDQCQGKFASWAGHLQAIRDEFPGDFYDRWHRLFETSFLERAVFDRYYARLTELLPHVPEARHLVHGDFGYGNVFVHEGRVSALLDWQNARYGDPAFDLAGMMFWRPEALSKQIFEAYQNAWQDAAMPTNLRERVLCYRTYLGLDALRYSARTDNRGLYDHVLTILSGV